MHILIDATGAIAGYTNTSSYPVDPGQTLVEAPPEFTTDAADEWFVQDGVLVRDAALALSRAQAERIARIKTEAAAQIEAIAWKLERVQEREAAGWAVLSDVDAVLAEREAVRRSSDAAEQAVMQLTDIDAVRAFTWQPDAVAVPLPNRVTRAAFLDALAAQGETVISGIVQAKDASPSLMTWWTYFDQAEYIAGTDPRLAPGLQGLEIAGLLPVGGAAAVMALVNGGAA